MVDRRTILKSGIAIGATGFASVVAGQSAESLVLNDFEDASAWPGQNALGNWADAGSFENDGGEVSDGALVLEYDNGGWFASNVGQSVEDRPYLLLTVRGGDGGEEDEIELRVGGASGLLSELSDDAVGTDWSVVAVDLEAAGADLANPDSVRLDFWQGGSGTLEIDEIAFAASADGTVPDDGGDGNENGSDDDDDDRDEDEEYDGEVTPETTIAEFYPDYQEEDVDRVLTEYLPDNIDDGYGDADQTNWPDEEKIAEFDVDVDAIREKADDGTLTFGELGTQAIDHVQGYEDEDFPRQASAKLLQRLAMLPDETEELTVHNPPQEVWDETAGPIEATNSPSQLIQDPWPPDARDYDEDEVAIRDRAHDQPQHEDQEGWTTHDNIPDDRYYNDDNPIHEAATEKVHPATGESLGGDGFTANAPMSIETRIHVENDGYWYQILEFENTSNVPYHLNAAVIWWVGPMGGNGNLRDGHYNNEQRPSPGHGHPQRDVIAVSHDEDAGLTAYAIRIAFHDEPYHMRTAYPNQKWSLEVGTSRPEGYFETSEERQELVETMAETCHVEIETDMDRNDDLLDALDLRNRMTN